MNDKTRESSDSDKTYEEGQKLIYDSFKHMTTLSTGSLLLLATFLKDLFDNPDWKLLIGISFFCFIVSIMSSVLTMKLVAHSLVERNETTEGHKIFGAVAYLISLGGFFSGIIIFVIFSLKNFY